MSLDECVKTTPYRHYKMWMIHFKMEQNEPDRADHYVMQNTMELRSVIQALAKSRRSYSFKDFFIEFVSTNKKKPKASTEQRKAAAEAAKRRWFGFVSGKRK